MGLAVSATGCRCFVHTFNSSKRGKTVYDRPKDKGHGLLAESRGKISEMSQFVQGVEASKKSLL